MKARLLCALALVVAFASTGCHSINLCDGCHGHGRHAGIGGGGGSGVADGRRVNYGHHQTRTYDGPPGPATAQVGYPYYTVRGPRDFLVNNPPSIGN